ncbi:MAG: hypothetical protein ACE15F_23430, partial [bacterium]
MFSYFSRIFKAVFQNRTDSELQVLFDNYTRIVEACARELKQLFSGEVDERPLCFQRIVRFKTDGDQLKRRL